MLTKVKMGRHFFIGLESSHGIGINHKQTELAYCLAAHVGLAAGRFTRSTQILTSGALLAL